MGDIIDGAQWELKGMYLSKVKVMFMQDIITAVI